MLNKTVSIIVPIYNVAPYLAHCIESILAQTYDDLQVILVDDGSTDGGGAICDHFATQDSRIVVHHQVNQGVSTARNKGLELAQGEYLMFVDSDDYVAPQLIEHLLRLLTEYKADIAMCVPMRTQKQNNEYTECVEKLEILNNMNILSKLYCDQYTFCEDYATYISPVAKIYKKELFNNLKFPVGRFYEDGAIMFIPLHRAKSIVVTNQQMYFYYQRSGSTSRKPFDATKLDRLTAFEDQMSYYKEHGLTKLHYYAMNTYLNMFSEFYWSSGQAGNLDKFGPYLKKRFRKEWRIYRRKYYFTPERWLELEEFSHPQIVGIYRKIKKDGLIRSVIKKIMRH